MSGLASSIRHGKSELHISGKFYPYIDALSLVMIWDYRLYNDAYVQGADAMIPYYPNMDEERLNRHELSIVL